MLTVCGFEWLGIPGKRLPRRMYNRAVGKTRCDFTLKLPNPSRPPYMVNRHFG